METENKPRFDTGNFDICDCECRGRPGICTRMIPCGTACVFCGFCIKIGLMKSHYKRAHATLERAGVDTLREAEKRYSLLAKSQK